MNSTQGLLFLTVVVIVGNINVVATMRHHADISNRLLTSAGPITVDDTSYTHTNYREERGPDGAWVSRLAEADNKVWKLQKFDMKLSEKIWFMMRKDPKDLFKTFDIVYNTWKKIDRSKRTVQWFRFVKTYRAKYGGGSFTEYDMYTLLRTKVPDEKLAIVFESMKQIPDLKSLAETMQKYQLQLWIDRGETPISIRKMLGIPHSVALTTEQGPKDEILSLFTKMYTSRVGAE
ncbi:unnamed protein product [Phytophthora fragariaefolia]|uniref:Unnamed protein product n=1 Tax=Phytophthora fragariaefolia TaxID=1490495 RepID=A0A9W6X8F0_9STRA|nr:unnamed protein product [Phytophthora fragariaefolia]